MNKLQKELLNILLDINDVAKKNNIKYSLSGGTLLGAVRHGGFIPWDDDIDIEIHIDEYENFLKILKRELPNKYEVVWIEGSTKTKDGFAKIINKEKKITRHFLEEKEEYNYLMVEIFPFVNASRNKSIFLKTLLIINFLKNGKSKDKRYFNIFSKVFKIFPQKFINKNILNSFKKMDKNGKYWDILFWKHKKNVEKKWGDELLLVEFEKELLPIYKDYDSYLTQRYGDWKKIPEKDKREIHDIEIINQK